MPPVLSIDQCRVFHDGTVSEPRLLHPEGVAVDREGDVWCGGELGQIYRISADGGVLEERASTGGFTLGVAFDANGRLYTCDLKHRAVFRFDSTTDELVRFAELGAGATGPPNMVAVDTRRNVLYVSESAGPEPPAPGIWRFDLESGEGGLWYDRPLAFANGIALASDGDALYVAETFARRIVRVPIDANGDAGDAEVVVELESELPDGLALDTMGNLYIACYEPSRILRHRSDGTLEIFVDDPEAHTLCHPTNCAFRGSELFIANLGRWHVTVVETGIEGVALPVM